MSALIKFINNKKKMLGGGYTTDISKQIADMPEISRYDDIKIHGGSKKTAKKNSKTARKTKKAKKNKN